MQPSSVPLYSDVQRRAKGVLARLGPTLNALSTERSVADTCVSLLRDQGVTQTWYHNCPAFVLLGSRSCLSISGKDYQPDDEAAGETNLITVDLSPIVDGFWGDCARSFYVENGRWTEAPADPEFVAGQAAQKELHRRFQSFVTPERTFDEVYVSLNKAITELGFENLDFLGNLGHSIVKRREDRLFFEKGNGAKLREVDFFTFEPHIRQVGGRWGFKHENIYFFDSNKVKEL